MKDVLSAASLGDLRRTFGGQSAGALYAAPIGFETDSDAAMILCQATWIAPLTDGGRGHQAFMLIDMEAGSVDPPFRRMPAHFGNRMLIVSKLPLSLPAGDDGGI